jgi:hypothetical protein
MFSSYQKQALTVMISPLCTNCHDIFMWRFKHCSRGHRYLCGDNTAVGDIALCVEV